MNASSWVTLIFQTYIGHYTNNAELGFEILKNRVKDASRRHSPKRRATINNPSWINNDVKQVIGRRQRAFEKKGSTMKKLSQNALQLGDKLKEL